MLSFRNHREPRLSRVIAVLAGIYLYGKRNFEPWALLACGEDPAAEKPA